MDPVRPLLTVCLKQQASKGRHLVNCLSCRKIDLPVIIAHCFTLWFMWPRSLALAATIVYPLDLATVIMLPSDRDSLWCWEVMRVADWTRTDRCRGPPRTVYGDRLEEGVAAARLLSWQVTTIFWYNGLTSVSSLPACLHQKHSLTPHTVQ